MSHIFAYRYACMCECIRHLEDIPSSLLTDLIIRPDSHPLLLTYPKCTPLFMGHKNSSLYKRRAQLTRVDP